MKKRYIPLILILIAFAIATTLIVGTIATSVSRANAENYRLYREERARVRRIIWKADYADDLLFHALIYVDGEMLLTTPGVVSHLMWPVSIGTPSFYYDIVFVHSKEEALGFPPNIIVAWPATEEGINEATIYFMHLHVNMSDYALRQHGISRAAVTLEEFGLTYPITVTDFVDNWESVAALQVATGFLRPPPEE